MKSRFARTGRDRRGTRDYRLTAKGRRAVQRWLTPPLPDTSIAAQRDPIRARLFFLQLLPARQRARFLDTVLEQLEAQVDTDSRALREATREGDRIMALAVRGHLVLARARLRWFREVCRELGASPRAGAAPRSEGGFRP